MVGMRPIVIVLDATVIGPAFASRATIPSGTHGANPTATPSGQTLERR